MHMPYTLDWDGEHVPEQLKRLPPGRYVLIEADADDVSLSNEEETGLIEALEAARAGQTRTLDEVRARVADFLSK